MLENFIVSLVYAPRITHLRPVPFAKQFCFYVGIFTEDVHDW